MIAQQLVDTLADELVADGQLVSYSSLQRVIKAHLGKGVSDRDLQAPYASWRQRRRYKGHLAVLDLPEEMEKAIAAFASTTMQIAEARAQAAFPITETKGSTRGLLDQMQRIVTGLERQLSALADENRSLREQIDNLQPPHAAPPAEEPTGHVGFVREKRPRKTGPAALAAKAFWDSVIADLANSILSMARPMSVEELLDAVPQSTKDFASLAFQTLDNKALAHKLHQRIEGKKYGLFGSGDGRFCVIPLSPLFLPAELKAAAA